MVTLKSFLVRFYQQNRCKSAFNEILITAKYSFYIMVESKYFAVNEISINAKYSFYIIIESEYFARNEILITAKYFFYTDYIRE